MVPRHTAVRRSARVAARSALASEHYGVSLPQPDSSNARAARGVSPAMTALESGVKDLTLSSQCAEDCNRPNSLNPEILVSAVQSLSFDDSSEVKPEVPVPRISSLDDPEAGFQFVDETEWECEASLDLGFDAWADVDHPAEEIPGKPGFARGQLSSKRL